MLAHLSSILPGLVLHAGALIPDVDTGVGPCFSALLRTLLLTIDAPDVLDGVIVWSVPAALNALDGTFLEILIPACGIPGSAELLRLPAWELTPPAPGVAFVAA